ncbi:MAG: SUMF1/EgtB/PvdO family nonheme iron enzyme, partial [Acidobacteriota bacterium]
MPTLEPRRRLVLSLALALGLLAPGCGTKEAPAPAAASADPHAAPHQPGADAAAPDRSALPVLNTDPAPTPAPAGMVWVPGGDFWMGCADCGMPDALPVHLVSVPGFWMDRTPVTNRDFAAFVKATDYVTMAERRPDPREFPGVPLDKLVPGSSVFTAPSGPVPLDDYLQWWRYVPGADWRHPDGPRSSLAGRERHP